MDKKGRPEAEVGYNDDLIMALAIAYYIRNQQSFNLLPNTDKTESIIRDDFAIRTNVYSRDDDFGSDIEVIQEERKMKKRVYRELHKNDEIEKEKPKKKIKRVKKEKANLKKRG